MKKFLPFVIFVSLASLLIVSFAFIYGCGRGGGGVPSGGADIFVVTDGQIKASGTNYGTINVKVENLNDATPMQGITVEAMTTAEAITSEVTDANGECVLNSLPPGKLFVTAYASSELVITVLCNASDIKFYIRPPGLSCSTGTVTGEVRDAGGSTLAGVYVYASGKIANGLYFYDWGQTNSNGKYILEDVPAVTILVAASSPELGGSFEVSSLSPGASIEVNIRFSSSYGTLQGTVNTGGKTLNWVDIMLFSSSYDLYAKMGNARITGGNAYSSKVPPSTNEIKYALTSQGSGASYSSATDFGPIDVSGGQIITKNYALKDNATVVSPSTAQTGVSATPLFSWSAPSGWTPSNYDIFYYKKGDVPPYYRIALGKNETSMQLPQPFALDQGEEYSWYISSWGYPSFDPSQSIVSAGREIYIAADSATFETAP